MPSLLEAWVRDSRRRRYKMKKHLEASEKHLEASDPWGPVQGLHSRGDTRGRGDEGKGSAFFPFPRPPRPPARPAQGWRRPDPCVSPPSSPARQLCAHARRPSSAPRLRGHPSHGRQVTRGRTGEGGDRDSAPPPPGQSCHPTPTPCPGNSGRCGPLGFSTFRISGEGSPPQVTEPTCLWGHLPLCPVPRIICDPTMLLPPLLCRALHSRSVYLLSASVSRRRVKSMRPGPPHFCSALLVGTREINTARTDRR